ncbi:putative fructose-bisphosphate aldolase [Colletotrichum viniferum]|nr:putative fructose-bisphosphate aldolase [Colletotrichum viniferum]
MPASNILKANKALDILHKAAEGRYGVLAATVYNVEQIIGVVRAAERKRSPLIIQLFPWLISLSNGVLVHTAAQAAKQATVPIAVHLDHCQDEDTVKMACDLPFDSLMVDMSHHSKATNLAKTREWVEYCHSKGKATEAEPGRIEGGEDGISDTADLSGEMTTLEEAQNFVDTGVGSLAPAFGNVHGEYGPRGIILEWDRLANIHRVTSKGGVVLALHGFNKFPDDLTQQLVASGITKVNISRGVLEGYYEHIEKNINRIPFTDLLKQGTEIVAQRTSYYMDVVASTGKA